MFTLVGQVSEFMTPIKVFLKLTDSYTLIVPSIYNNWLKIQVAI